MGAITAICLTLPAAAVDRQVIPLTIQVRQATPLAGLVSEKARRHKVKRLRASHGHGHAYGHYGR